MKFGAGAEPHDPYQYSNTFERELATDGQERLLIGPSRGHVDVMIELIECLPEPLRLLYILVVPRNGQHDAGRYEAARELSIDETASFIREFRDFLESDGRHHLWVANPGHGTIVYDRHDVLYAYGSLNRFQDVLEANGFTEGKVEIPNIHWHA
jgi:hypothetical protein